MTLASGFSLLQSEFNPFLFATIGEEANGVELTVLSALTRLGVDPWQEASRLAGLPRTAASATFAEMLTRLPNEAWDASENRSIAARLIEKLPLPTAARLLDQRARPVLSGRLLRAAALILFILVAAVAYFRS
jgi:hypothetical protein